MSDRNTTMIPCQDCKREGEDYLVEVDIPDDVLKECYVENADELSEEVLALLLSEKRISAQRTCSLKWFRKSGQVVKLCYGHYSES